MFPMRILSDPSGSVEILALGIELGDLALMEFEGSKVVGILEQAALGVERFYSFHSPGVGGKSSIGPSHSKPCFSAIAKAARKKSSNSNSL